MNAQIMKKYESMGFDEGQVEEIRLALEHKADVGPYLIKEFLGESIREIRLGLEEGLDVSVYKSMMYSAKEMEQIRQRMLEQLQKKHKEPADNGGDFRFEDLQEQAKLASECLVTVSQDKMEAYVTLEKGSCKTKNEIMRALAKENVVFGIKQDAIEKYIKESEQAASRFLAAELKKLQSELAIFQEAYRKLQRQFADTITSVMTGMGIRKA